MNELLSLAKKFKAVGLIAVLIQHKNQKDKRKRERQRARELASRSTSPRRKQRDALLGSVSGSKKKGSGIRKGDIKKLIASSPSTTSSNSVPTYPYGEAMSTPSTKASNSEQKEVTYPYGDMSPSAPSHMSLRMAYDSDGDDAMDLKKANARARRNMGTEKEGAKTASGEYRTGLMRLVASSNTPAPVSPTSAQQSPFAMAHLREPSLHSIPLGGRSPSSSSALPTFSIPSASPSLAPSSSALASTGQPVLFSLPAYTPPVFSIPATTIRQGGQRTSSPLMPPIVPSSSPFSNSHSPGSTTRGHPFSIPTLLIEKAPPLATAPAPSSLSASPSLSVNVYLSAPRPVGINQELR